MDAVSYSLASKQAQRIEKFIENPDSTSGIVTVPKVIASGDTITIPAGRVAVLPNVQIDGTLNVEGEVFVPSGATLGDLDAQLALKADTSYVNAQLVLKQNVLVANDAGVKTALNASGTAPIFACRAWVNFNGTGTVAIRASGNISSITDNEVGGYTVNFTTAMSDANYGIVGVAREDSVSNTANFSLGTVAASLPTTSSFKIFISNNVTAGSTDSTIICASIFR